MKHHVPVVLQTSQTECGLCASLSLLSTYGRRERLVDLRAEATPGRDGLSAGELVRLLRSRGMRTSVFRAADASALEHVDHPVLLFWEKYHWVVLERVSRGAATIVDPAYGRRTLTRDELARGFSGIVIDAVPGCDFRTRRAVPFSEWRSLPLRAQGLAWPATLSVILVVLGYGVTLGLPWIVQSTIDAYIGPGDFSAIPVLIGILGAAACFYVVSVARTFVLARVIRTLGHHLMSRIFERLLRLPYPYFATRPTGELLFRLSSANAVRDLLSTRAVQFVVDLGTFVTLMFYLALVSVPLAAVTGVVVLAVGLVLLVSGRAVRTRIDSELSSSSKSQILQLDVIASIATVKMAGHSDRVARRWREQYGETMRATESRMRLQQGVIGSAVSAVQLFGPVAILATALALASADALSLGQAVATQAIAGVLFGVVGSLYTAYTDFALTSRAVGRLSDITGTATERADGAPSTSANTTLALENVEFRYSPGAPPALSGVTAVFPAGTTTAVVGASGSGKSTLAGVLSTLFEPTAGTVRFGGEDVAGLDLDSVRSRIGYVPQNAVLLNGTILDNLVVGTNLADAPDLVEERCRRMTFLDFVDALPMGYRTIVSDLGGNLSGGQRQRIAIARALLSEPDVLVLDEATSALDAFNERRVVEHVRGLGCTRIVFAHREATVRSADDILVMSDGRLAQRGTHDDLLAIPGIYRDLYADDTADAVIGTATQGGRR